MARNRGVLALSAPLVAFMDQDDLWSPQKLAHQVDALACHADAGLCYCDLKVLGRGQSPGIRSGADLAAPSINIVLEHLPGRSALAASMAHFGNSFVVPSTVMVRREILARTGLLAPWRPFTGDFDLLIRAGGAAPVAHVASEDVLYRLHAEQFTRRYRTGRAELREMRRQYLQHARTEGDSELHAAARHQLRRPRRLYAAQAFDEEHGGPGRGGISRATAGHLAMSALDDPREPDVEAVTRLVRRR